MRLYILRALLRKEFHRHLANRGGMALAFLLIAAAVLLSVFNPGAAGGGEGGGTGMVGGVHHCLIEYANETPLIKHLKATVPAEYNIRFVDRGTRRPNEMIAYQPGVGAIHLRVSRAAGGEREQLTVQVWHPKGDVASMAPYEDWFYREARRHYQNVAVQYLNANGIDSRKLESPDFGGDDLWPIRESFDRLDAEFVKLTSPSQSTIPVIQFERQGLAGKVLDLRSAIATGMVVFALYFACVYLLPTLNCEERERGVLLAQALSPASPLEILAAKFLFYPVLGIGLAAILAGIYKPAVLSSLFFWLSLTAVASGFLGIGMTIATLAKTQRAAFLGAMCYLLSVSLILFICSTNGIPYVNYLALEYHGPRILHAALSGDFQAHHWLNLAGASILAVVWMTAAAYLFRRRGWQ